MTKIADIIKDMPVSYGQCDMIVNEDMSVQEVFSEIVANGHENIGVYTDWSEKPVILNRQQILQALLGEVESLQTTLTLLQKQIHENSIQQLDELKTEIITPPAQGNYQKLELAVKVMTEGLITLDSTGQIDLINPAAKQLLGVDNQADLETIGYMLDQLGFKALMKFSDQSGGKKSGQFRIKSHHTRLLEVRWSVLNNDLGCSLGWVLTIRDITNEIAAENTKSEFIAAISHELRTPLTSIQNSVSNILAGVTGKINDKTKGYLEIMKSDCHRFADLINDLLDIAKLEAGNMPITQRAMTLESLVQNTVEEFSRDAEKTGITLACEIEPNICSVYADGKRIRQVLTNLLRNALQHTPPAGKISVSVHDSGSEIITEVADTGGGIPIEMQKQLFTKFYQVARQAGPGSKGNGLGLAISKGIVAVHGGTIWVESEPDRGSRFFFSLPKINPIQILRKHLELTVNASCQQNNRFQLMIWNFEMKQKSEVPLRRAAGKIISELLSQSKFFMASDLDIALQTGEHEIIFVINDIGRQTVESVQQKIEMNLLNFLKKHFIGVPIMPMLGKSVWPQDGSDAGSLEQNARNCMAPLIAR